MDEDGAVAVEVEGLRVEYNGETAVEGMSFGVRQGELFCLLGPSGCGKTTTLRAIAGLENPDGGEVYVDGECVTDEPPNSRDTSVVFQEWALFPRKTVIENVEFALKMEGMGTQRRREKAESVIGKVGLSGRETAYPEELSGGQKQRVALARSLAADPSVLLLDEPLSNLDEGLRREMRFEVMRLHEEFKKTTIHVTHDQQEAFTLGDRVGVMREGSLVQIGKPSEVYSDPNSRFVEAFLGESTFLKGTVSADGGVKTPVGVGEKVKPDAVGDTIEVSLRPEEVALSSVGASADGGEETGDATVGTVVERIDHGSAVRYRVGIEGLSELITAEYSARSDPDFEEGEPVEVSLIGEPPAFDQDGRRVM